MRKYLTQAMLAESISRLEDAARTQAEFKNVIEWWDKRDKRIKDALDKKVLPIANTTFDIDLYGKGDHRMKSLFSGRNHYYVDYLNLIFSCICQMHDLTDDSDLSRLLGKATDKQKAVFFPRVIKGCTPQRIALCHGMTDRNVRDIVDRTVSKIRKGMYEALKKRQAEGISLTMQQKDFLNTIDEEKNKDGR
jgi:DNA-directed RNA polymerase specialized sigma24 family protein